MMKKTNAKRILAAALAGMMALSLSACGEQGGGSPAEGATTESASTAAVAAETKAEAGAAAEPQDSGKTGEEATGGPGRPEAAGRADGHWPEAGDQHHLKHRIMRYSGV